MATERPDMALIGEFAQRVLDAPSEPGEDSTLYDLASMLLELRKYTLSVEDEKDEVEDEKDEVEEALKVERRLSIVLAKRAEKFEAQRDEGGKWMLKKLRSESCPMCARGEELFQTEQGKIYYHGRAEPHTKRCTCPEIVHEGLRTLGKVAE